MSENTFENLESNNVKMNKVDIKVSGLGGNRNPIL